MGKTNVKTIRISFNENIKLHADLLAEFKKYTTRERNIMIIAALSEYFLSGSQSSRTPDTVSIPSSMTSQNDELLSLIRQIGARLDDVEQAVAGHKQDRPVSGSGTAVGTQTAAENHIAAEKEVRLVAEKKYSHEPAGREEVQDAPEPDIPPAVLSMIEMLQNG